MRYRLTMVFVFAVLFQLGSPIMNARADDFTVPDGQTVTLTQDLNAGNVTINGTLDAAGYNITADAFNVGPSGNLLNPGNLTLNQELPVLSHSGIMTDMTHTPEPPKPLPIQNTVNVATQTANATTDVTGQISGLSGVSAAGVGSLNNAPNAPKPINQSGHNAASTVTTTSTGSTELN